VRRAKRKLAARVRRNIAMVRPIASEVPHVQIIRQRRAENEKSILVVDVGRGNPRRDLGHSERSAALPERRLLPFGDVRAVQPAAVDRSSICLRRAKLQRVELPGQSENQEVKPKG